MQKSNSGFTIAELIIVVSVIAILATIVTASYNGLTTRSSTSAVKNGLAVVAQKIGVYHQLNNEYYPDNLEVMEVKPTDGLAYQYTADNGSDPRGFCLSATSGKVSYFIADIRAEPSTGTCPTTSMLLLVSSQNTPNEGIDKLFDGSTSTKWLTFASTGWTIFATSSPLTATTYSLTSANDAPGRDPKNWTLYGSNNRISWTTLDSRSGETFSSRFFTKTYTITSAPSYQHYKLDITLNADGGNITQLAELTIGTSGSNATILTQQ